MGEILSQFPAEGQSHGLALKSCSLCSSPLAWAQPGSGSSLGRILPGRRCEQWKALPVGCIGNCDSVTVGSR